MSDDVGKEGGGRILDCMVQKQYFYCNILNINFRHAHSEWEIGFVQKNAKGFSTSGSTIETGSFGIQFLCLNIVWIHIFASKFMNRNFT